MADISQIKLPNGDTFDIVDNKSGFLEKNHSINMHSGSIDWETNSFQTQHGLTINSTSMWSEDEIGGQAILTVASRADSATITLDTQNYMLTLSSSSFSLHNNNATNYIKVSNNSGGLELHSLVSPTNDSDAATKKYVDDAIGGINVGVTKISTTAGAHTTITNATGVVSFNVPTHTSHLTNDSGFITSYIDEKIKLVQKSDNVAYKIILGPNSITSGNTYEGYYSTLYYNPSAFNFGTSKWYIHPLETGFQITGGITTNRTLTVNQTITLGPASEKSYTTSINTSDSLPTANAVKTFVENKGYITDAGVTTITTTAGTHTAITNATGAISFNIPTNTSHLTNDSGFITSDNVANIMTASLGTELTSGTDLNTLTTFGVYYYHNNVSDLVNAPDNAGMYMMLYVIPRAVGSRCIQIMYTTAGFFVRAQRDALSFYDWIKYASASAVEGREIANNTDLNSITTIGKYYTASVSATATITNKPTDLTSAFSMDVQKRGDYVNQIIYDYAGVIYIRGKISSGWYNWYKIPINEKDLTQKTTLTTSDYIRVVGSDNVSYKQSIIDVANVMAGRYNAISGSDTVTNANDALIGVWYRVYTSATNVPAQGALFTYGAASGKYQVVYTGTEMYTRAYTNSTWSTWIKMPTRTELINLTGIHSTMFSGDVDTLVDTGQYQIGNIDVVTNIPSGVGYGIISVIRARGYIKQIYSDIGKKIEYMRTSTNTGSTWTSWMHEPQDVPVREYGSVAPNASFTVAIDSALSQNEGFALVGLNIGGNALIGAALLYLGRGTSKIKDLIGSMSPSYYTASYANNIWTITNSSSSTIFYTIIKTR